MIARHLCAYKFAAEYVHNKSVLDIGCGEGYGSYYLSGFAKDVMGIDYDTSIIDYAKTKYQRGNLRFCVVDAKDINTVRDTFDVICSFQFIEHLGDAQAFLGKVKDLLRNGGVFICSTPNRKDASPNSEAPFNKFHVKEYLLDEFRELLGVYFKQVEVFGVRRGISLDFFRRLKKIGIFNFLPEAIDPVRRFYKRIGCDNFDIGSGRIETALDFIAICKAR